MNVIVLTIFIGVMLVSFFILFFLHQTSGKRRASGEQDALLPLQDESFSPVSRARANAKKSINEHEQQ